MGQANTKDPKRRRVGAPGVGVGGGGSRPPGVRPTAVNDSVLQLSGAGASRHSDPSRAHSTSRGSLPHPPSGPVGGAGSMSAGSPAATFPIVLRYQDQDVRALIEARRPVYVAVEAMNWQPLPMTPSADSFYALLELPAGNHNYRFLVNGMEVVDSTQPLAPSRAPSDLPVTPQQLVGVPVTQPLPKPNPARDGMPANTICLNDVLLATKEDDDIMDNGEGWGQEPIMFEESRKYPPIVPLHLRYTPLNTPPTLVRCSRDGRLAVMDRSLEHTSRMPPEHLPLPLSVTINHVYFQRREDHAVMGVTTRYCNKYTTVVYYSHLPTNPVDSLEPLKT
ncbi:SNF1-related protein kinase regulatory subunit beta [Novymonas esmeraldas]|uniref:SNF1-related protein kinase regulatory subunit beta n=1 Tax=Novymonas esmeraldas TaxID=1808958 RepID=A0AAW0EP77_9TRYP